MLVGREYRIIYWGPGFLDVVWFSSSPTTSPSVSKLSLLLSHLLSLCVAGRAYCREEGGKRQIIGRRERLVLYRTFNTLCWNSRYQKLVLVRTSVAKTTWYLASSDAASLVVLWRFLYWHEPDLRSLRHNRDTLSQHRWLNAGHWPSAEIHTLGKERRVQARFYLFSCSAFEQSKTWTEPQLNLRSSWASCTATIYPHFVCQVNQKRWKEKTDYENLLLLQKIQTVRPSRHVEGSVHFKRRSQS